MAETGAVTWLQYCSESERLAQIYRCADLFVHPGIQETFGLVTIESQACGTPVVGIHGSYMDRIILSDQGHWGRENTPRALADAIVAACEMDLKRVGERISKTAILRYSWDQVFDRLFAIYRSVIDR